MTEESNVLRKKDRKKSKLDKESNKGKEKRN